VEKRKLLTEAEAQERVAELRAAGITVTEPGSVTITLLKEADREADRGRECRVARERLQRLTAPAEVSLSPTPR
jgi:hypothetical protein